MAAGHAARAAERFDAAARRAPHLHEYLAAHLPAYEGLAERVMRPETKIPAR